ncbi:hypothetical protein [Nonomuraea sp. NPDC003754]
MISGKLRILAGTHVIPGLGKIKLQQLRADHVDEWLDQLAGNLVTTTPREIHSVLKRAIRQAQTRDMVLRDLAEPFTTPPPTGTGGRLSKALTRQQAEAVLKAARAYPSRPSPISSSTRAPASPQPCTGTSSGR